ncbi:alpha/beta fold hydrolase [Mucilaginibacter sp.]|uniref:alpha/beta fold hydrolase n=1 Tax=Mucilaginibacter sp. TaxID=1882438 RepID=UPI003D0C8D6E
MKKALTLLTILLLAVQFGFSQQKAINYGSNAAVGKYYNIRGFKMYCEVYGQGKPLLMIHGNGGSINNFAKIIPYFAKKYKVIVADSRAQGRSADSKDPLSFEMMADDYAVLLDTMHISKAYIIGWSDGGINALLIAMRHPQKVIKLASTGANLWPDSTALIPSLWKDMQKQYAASKNKVWETAKEKNAWKIFLLDYLQPNIPLSALKAIKCPSLIICGDHDLIPIEHTVLIYQHIAKANLWVVPNSGHGTLIEHTDDFDRNVNEFFTRKK